MPEVLIKADDLRLDKASPLWRNFLNFCSEERIHACVGVMGSTGVASDDPDTAFGEGKQMLQWLLQQPTLHIWNHGFTHKGDRATSTSEFLGAPLESQIDAIRRTQDRVEELCGVRMNAFGAPFNWTDHNTVLALQEFPELEYSFYLPYVPGMVNYHHELFVTCEPFEGTVKPGAPRRFDLSKALSKSQHFRDIGRSFVVQIHPNRWVDGALDDFASFVETLNAEGYVSGTVESVAHQDLVSVLIPRDNAAANEERDQAQARLDKARRLPKGLRRAVPKSVRERIIHRGK